MMPDKLPKWVQIIVLIVTLALLFCMLIAIKSFFLKTRITNKTNQYNNNIEEIISLCIDEYYILFFIVCIIAAGAGFMFSDMRKPWNAEDFIKNIENADFANLCLYRLMEHKGKKGWDDGVIIAIIDKDGKVRKIISDKENKK